MQKKKKPGRPLGSTLVMYTKAEEDLIRAVAINGKSNKENGEFLAKKLKRNLSGVLAKLILIKKELGLVRETSRSKRMTKPDELRSVVLPKNIALEFKASRAVLKENHIIIYFA